MGRAGSASGGHRTLRTRRSWGIVPVAFLLLAAACGGEPSGGPSPLDNGTITVGSFNFAESELLAETYAQALEGHGYEVDRQLDLGSRELVMPALERGLIELVPEYAGSALAFLGGTPSADSATTHAALRRELSKRHIRAFDASPAEDQNGFAVTATTAVHLGVRTISDLRPFADRMTLGGPTECPERPLCLRGLERVYGLRFAQFLPVDSGGPLTLEALRRGTIDVALMFTTDGSIRRERLVLLVDDRRLQPAENVTPLVRAEVLTRFGPGVREVLDAVSAALTTRSLRALNAVVDNGTPMEQAVRSWLDTRDLRTG
jgi:osmoprotectant transport system substrate-binding protein